MWRYQPDMSWVTAPEGAVFSVIGDKPIPVKAGEKVGMRPVVLADARKYSIGATVYDWAPETADIYCVLQGEALDKALAVWGLLPWCRSSCQVGEIQEYAEWKKSAENLVGSERDAHWQAFRASWAAAHNCRAAGSTVCAGGA